MKNVTLPILFLALCASACPESKACTRVVYVGENEGENNVITGRTLDWKEDIPSNLYIFPRGIKRQAYNQPNAIKWKSKYGSVSNVGFDMGVSEGMNEKGLVVNLLYLPGTSYTYPDSVEDNRQIMSSSLWAQYVLDNFAGTNEAVKGLREMNFRIDAPTMPGGAAATVHMAMSDLSGNSAIIEYLDGKLSIHEGEEYQVLTNAPPFEQQLDVRKYWQSIGGMNMLPGTNSSQDRFVRASFYINTIPRNADHDTALAGVFGVIFNCSVPVGISIPNSPEISSTRWRSVADQSRLTYYYGTTFNPAIMWVKLDEFKLSPGSPIMKLDLINPHHPYIGDVRDEMRPSKGFSPLFSYSQQ